VVQLDEKIFLKHLNRAEDFVAEFVAARCGETEEPVLAPADTRRFLDAAQGELGITFSAEQIHAVELAARHKFMIITGGPGCGKTTVTRALVSVFKHAGKVISLAAPTGRAAQRMSQVCGMPASTIHRLLRYDPSRGGFLHGINDPLIADVIIVDEASMVDVVLAKDLFSAIPRNATLILVGDKDQLPSVGPGRVFGDLVSLREVKTVALSKLFRRSEESTINAIALMINSGATPDIPEPDGITKADGYFIPRKDASEAAATIEKLVADQIPRKFGIDPREITVLTPSNRGPLGTIALNQLLQQRLNPPGAFDSEQELQHNGVDFRVGDRVCQRVNNYQIDPYGVFNGDSGTVHSVSKSERSLVVEMWDGRLVKYAAGDIGQLSLAYAVTVHRSQGSEIPCVVLAIHESHFTLLERQLMYTAVTRAKKLLIVVGSKKALMLATKRMNSKRRLTLLAERIRLIVH
jgi:exodeoxyribonuclease V alpha subunit